MARRRNIDLSNRNKFKLKNLTNGPSKFYQAFDINTSLNGIDLCGDELFIKTKKDLDTDEEILSYTLGLILIMQKSIKISYGDFFKGSNDVISRNL
jgi:3-methyladenine DNA glycosylase Mpg